MPGSEESLVLDKMRRVLLNDATVKTICSSRVYPAHLSTLSGVVFPAITLHAMSGIARPENPSLIQVVVSVDVWVKEKDTKQQKIHDLTGVIRTLFQRQPYNDTTIGIRIIASEDAGRSGIMKEDDTGILHESHRYEILAVRT